jgi:hypothetical protein
MNKIGGLMSTIDDRQNLNHGEAAEPGSDRNVRDVLGERLAFVPAGAPHHRGEQS